MYSVPIGIFKSIKDYTSGKTTFPLHLHLISWNIWIFNGSRKDLELFLLKLYTFIFSRFYLYLFVNSFFLLLHFIWIIYYFSLNKQSTKNYLIFAPDSLISAISYVFALFLRNPSNCIICLASFITAYKQNLGTTFQFRVCAIECRIKLTKLSQIRRSVKCQWRSGQKNSKISRPFNLQ